VSSYNVGCSSGRDDDCDVCSGAERCERVEGEASSVPVATAYNDYTPIVAFACVSGTLRIKSG
jgi:hypothetical protein